MLQTTSITLAGKVWAMSELGPFNSDDVNNSNSEYSVSEETNQQQTMGGRVPVQPNDVAGGRGRFIIRRPGNDKFEELINYYAPMLKSAGGDMEMADIQIEIMAQLLPGARIMTKYCKKTDTAVELTPKGARAKVGQAIRYRIAATKRQVARVRSRKRLEPYGALQSHPQHSDRQGVRFADLKLDKFSSVDSYDAFQMGPEGRLDTMTQYAHQDQEPLCNRQPCFPSETGHVIPPHMFRLSATRRQQPRPQRVLAGHSFLEQSALIKTNEAISSAARMNAHLINQLQADPMTSAQDHEFPPYEAQGMIYHANTSHPSSRVLPLDSRFDEQESFHSRFDRPPMETQHPLNKASSSISTANSKKYSFNCLEPRSQWQVQMKSELDSIDDTDPLPLDKEEDIFRN